MNLPPDKVRLLRSYDNEKKWELICDQVGGVLHHYLLFPLGKHAKTWLKYDDDKYNSHAGFWIRCFTCDIIILFMLDAGKVPGEEPSSHIYPETARFPRPSCNSQGEMGNAVWR